ncbi:hypothetical protein MACK_003857 [Theileria orientalis]|uniref:Uncharacterized protein n=1 Tax=Theileria orientalis TaxID=68886 RepID=A0A976SJ16_THEOR|nr:hypothetical protein MACK_003857 [Theileria orientalis]
MSTLKAARADNFYFPPEEDYSRQKKRIRRNKYNKYEKFHTDKSDKTGDIWSSGRKGPTIRFEMPFKVICLKCNAYIAKGVRFDAEKRAVGKYYSTDIYAFRMSCFSCFNRIVIQTDPENTEYICKEGVRKKIELKSKDDPEVITVSYDVNEKQMRATNALYILEQQAEESLRKSRYGEVSRDEEEREDYEDNKHGVGLGDEVRNRQGNELAHTQLIKEELNKFVSKPLERDDVVDDEAKIEYLEDLSESRNKDYYLANSALRRRFRMNKKLNEENKHENFSIPLLKVEKEDIEDSKKITFISQNKKLKSHFKRLINNKNDIFSKNSVKTSSTISVPNTLDEKKKKLQFIKYIESKAKKG